MQMTVSGIRKIVSVAALSLALGACATIKCDSDVDTDDGEGALGKGPGLISGKRGGFEFPGFDWDGAAPNDPLASE